MKVKRSLWLLMQVFLLLAIVLQSFIGNIISVQASQILLHAPRLSQTEPGTVTITAGNCLGSTSAQYKITQNQVVIAQGSMTTDTDNPPHATINVLASHSGEATIEVRCGSLPANITFNCTINQNPALTFSGFTSQQRSIICNTLHDIAGQLGGDANFLNLVQDAADHANSPDVTTVTYQYTTTEGAHWDENTGIVYMPERLLPPSNTINDATDASRSYLPTSWRTVPIYRSVTIMHETNHMLQAARPNIKTMFEAIYQDNNDSFLYPSGNTSCIPSGRAGYEVEAQIMALVIESAVLSGKSVVNLTEAEMDAIADDLSIGASCGHAVRPELVYKIQDVVKSLQPAVFRAFIGVNGCISAIEDAKGVIFDCSPQASIIDTVIVMDTTGSMGTSIQGFKNAMINYVNALENAGTDYRVAVVDYKDKLYDSYASRVDLGFSKTQTDIVSAINGLYASGGGDTPEDVYSGVMSAVNLPWRNGAKKVIILVGDAGPHDPESQTGYTLHSVIAAANAVDPANIYAIRVGNNTAMRSVFQQLADGTGGMVFDTSYNSNDVSAALLRAVNAITYFPSAVVGILNETVSGAAGTPILFDGSHSFDPNGFIVRYEWDFNNDGIFDVSTSAPTVSHSYPAAYSGWIILQVTDNNGNTAKVKVRATVSTATTDTTPPVIVIISPTTLSYLHTDSLNISWSVTDSGSGVFSSVATLDGITITNDQSIDLFFMSLGLHTLTVNATDKAGNNASQSITFAIGADINSLIIAEQRACALGWIDGSGVCNSLEAKLLAARSSIERGKFSTARNQLNAFLAELKAQSGKKVTQGYDVLKDDTNYVMTHLP